MIFNHYLKPQNAFSSLGMYISLLAIVLSLQIPGLCEISGGENKILGAPPNSQRTSTSKCILDIGCIGFGGRGQRLIILLIRISEFILKSSKFWISLQHFEQKSWVLSHKLSCRTLISLLRSENNGVGYQ